MNRFLVMLAAGFFAGSAMAATDLECTSADKDTCMAEQDFKDKAKDLGYEVDNFSVSEGNCYTLTKIDAANDDELEYFNPVTGEVVVN